MPEELVATEASRQRVKMRFTLPPGRCREKCNEDDVFMFQGAAVGYQPKMGGYPDLHNQLLDKCVRQNENSTRQGD